MSINTNTSNKDNPTQIILTNRQYIEDEVNRILKKSPNLKIGTEKKKLVFDFLYQNLPFILENLNKTVDIGQIETLKSKSKNDIRLAKLAYKIKDYSNAVYLLQQSIEKAVKAYGLSLCIIKDPKTEISHSYGVIIASV